MAARIGRKCFEEKMLPPLVVLVYTDLQESSPAASVDWGYECMV